MAAARRGAGRGRGDGGGGRRGRAPGADGGAVAAVALAEEKEDGTRQLIGGFRLQSGFTHSQTLMPMLEHMRELARFELSEIDYLAVASGPGSFTGLRIGASAAKGLAFALEKKIVPVPTLDAMAYQMAGACGMVCPMMDARRQQVYAGLYAFRQQGTRYDMIRLLPPSAIPVEELTGIINRHGSADREETPVVHLLGDGVPVYLADLQKQLAVPYATVPLHRDRQSAEAVCALAFDLVKEGKAVDADAFVPEYLRSGPQPAVKDMTGESAQQERI